MSRAIYQREALGTEVEAPSGYYRPAREEWLIVDGRPLLYVLGTACIEASCCGAADWAYLRVEGYPLGGDPIRTLHEEGRLELEAVAEADDRRAIITMLRQRHPGVRIEFR